MYPNVALVIKNHQPNIVFSPEENSSRQMTMKSEDLSDVIEHIAKEFELIDDMIEQIQEKEIKIHNLLEIARNADSSIHSHYPDINTESLEFELEEIVKKLVSEAKKLKDEFEDIEGVEGEVLEELKRNQNADYFASMLENLYNILIAKTLIAASEIGVGTIKLQDDHKNPRLQEKMAQELENLDLDLIIE